MAALVGVFPLRALVQVVLWRVMRSNAARHRYLDGDNEESRYRRPDQDFAISHAAAFTELMLPGFLTARPSRWVRTSLPAFSSSATSAALMMIRRQRVSKRQMVGPHIQIETEPKRGRPSISPAI